MRAIKQTSQFKRDLKRESRGVHKLTLQRDFVSIVSMLANDLVMPEKYRDHALAGEWAAHRDCHIKPDLVLIYSKPNIAELLLVRLGSHSELGL